MRSKFFGVIVLATALGFATGGTVFAMPSDSDLNTAQMTKLFPESLSLPVTLGFGMSADYVIDRTLDDKSDIGEGVWWGGNVYWDPLENVHTDVFLGVGQYRVGSVGINNNSTTKVELQSDNAFSAGVGGKVDIVDFAVLPNQPNMKLYGAGAYRHTGPADVDQIHASFEPVTFDLQTELNEWNATIGVSQRWNNPIAWLGWGDWLNFNAVTYVGAQYNDVSLNISGSSTLPKSDPVPTQSVTTGGRSSDDAVAVVTGLQILSFNDTWAFGLEGRFIAETAVSINGRFRW